MYQFNNYSNMVRDRVRVLAYRRALDDALTPDSVVLDLGAGTGAFAIYAAAKGARKVYAIETNPLIELGKLQAQALGLADRIEFVNSSSLSFNPDERANIMVSDLRGMLPFLGDGREVLEDAKKRLLTADAVLIPLRDRLYVAPFSDAKWYHQYVEAPWQTNHLGISMPVLRQVQANTPVAASGVDLRNAMPAAQFGLIDYVGEPEPPVISSPSWRVEADTELHGLLLWFDAELAASVSYSSAPGADAPWVYGRLLLPLERPLAVAVGDTVDLKLGVWPTAGDWSYTWNTCVRSPDGTVRVRLAQNSVKELLLLRGARRSPE